LVLLLLMIPVDESLHRNLPAIEGEKSDHLVVIGDSISAGLGAVGGTRTRLARADAGDDRGEDY
jgi:hypothetical protein